MTRNDLFKKYLNPFFIETGSYIGDGIQEALDANFSEIYSIELSDKYFNISYERFKNNEKVHIIKGDSSILLYDLIKDINQNITFWLDAHCSEGDTAKGIYYTPLIQELEQIKKHQINTHTIIIDDMRLWDEKDDKIGFGKDKIIEKILEINPNYELIYENGYIDNDILVAKIKDGNMKVQTIQTPIGEISAFENDSFGIQLKTDGKYLEQNILDDNLRPIIEKSNFILDIGAHVGYHSIAYAKYNPKSTIIAIEPQSNIFSLLKQNIEKNGLTDRIAPINCALGDKERDTTLLNYITDGPNIGDNIEYGTDKEFNLGGVSIGFNGEFVKMMTIDSLNLQHLDYMKIDVEGAETLVIMGGEKTIKKFKPVICFEHNYKKIDPEFIKLLGYNSLPTPFEILKSFGYTSFERIPYENFVATYSVPEIGLIYQNYPVVSIGDTICLTPIIEAISKERNELINVCTPIPELFFNNPYVKDITQNQNPNINLYPCVAHGCNAIEYYAKQTNHKLSKKSKPKIYLTNDEIEYGKNALAEFEGYKKIAVSLKSSTEVKDLKYDYLSPLLNRLKRNGYKLIGVGKEKSPNQYDYDKTFINKTTIREVCAIINECDLYLGVDAGLYHIAAALDVPQVVFFKNNHASINSYSDTHYIDSKIECKGECLIPHITKCYNSVRCMDSFDLDEYYNLIVRILPIISFRIMTENDLEFFTEVRNLCAEEYLHDSRKFAFDEVEKWFKNLENSYYIIECNNSRIGYFRTSNYSHKNKNIYIGCDLHENWRGKGLSYIAYRKFITFLFEKQKLHKISLEVLSSNIRAINLYKKLGFVEEGRKREDIEKGQIYVDSVIMSILKKEWKERSNMEKKVCYVVNFYFGNRRYNINTFKVDKFCYLRSQIDALTKYKHSLSKIVFSFNIEPEHYSLLSEAIKLIPLKLQNSDIEINIRDNIGMSYGAFSDIFGKNMDAYDYYIFNEDDYVIVQDNFDEYLVNKFESIPNCGYLCGLVREIAHFEKNRHAGMSSGISSYKILKEVWDKYGELPHSKGKDYTDNEKRGQTIQTVAIRDLGYEIYDIREEYRMKFWSGDDLDPESTTGRINIHFMWKDKDLFLPTNIYLGESYNWTDRIDPEFLRMECDYNSSKYYPYL